MLLSICPSEEEELSDGYGLSSHSECYTSRDIMIRIGSRSWGKIREGSTLIKYITTYANIGYYGSGGMV